MTQTKPVQNKPFNLSAVLSASTHTYCYKAVYFSEINANDGEDCL